MNLEKSREVKIMKKTLLILIVGILILNGFGAVALDKDIEKLDSDAINYKKTNDEKRDFTHTVLGEYGTATWCGFCHYAHTALKNIYASGDFPFYYVSLVSDKTPGVCNPRLSGDLNLYGYPTVYFDGGDEVVVGGYTGVENDYEAAITSCGNRAVYDVDIDLTVIWLGDTEMEIDVSVDNNEGSTYDGTIRVYITEIVSSMGWKDTTGQLYTFPLLDIAFKDDGTGKVISIPAGSTWSDSTIWVGSDYGFTSITSDNIMVIAAVFNDEWHQGYSYPPSSNPFDAYYVDDTIAVTPYENAPPETPGPPDGPDEGVVNEEYEFSAVTTDPDEDQIYYNFSWGDETYSGWIGPVPSGTSVEESHAWDEAGDYDVKVKAKDTNDLDSEWSEVLHVTIVNEPPNAPRITGKTNVKAGVENCWTFHSEDPNGDQIKYIIDWGDGTTNETDCYPSCTPVEVCHTYNDQGTYTIKAKAKECTQDGLESEWKERIVNVPRNRAMNLPFLNLLQNFLVNHPNLFPILRFLLQR
jgi:hypothetical protein